MSVAVGDGAGADTVNGTTFAVGIDIGGTKTAAGLVDLPTGAVVARQEAPTPATSGPDAVLATAIHLAERVLAAAPASASVVSVGVGAAGVIDPVGRVVVSATDTLPGWAGTRIGEAVEAAVGLPVLVENDVHAHALGEAGRGAGRGHRTVLVVAAGTGIGGALVSDGSLVRGAGHVAGHYGHLPSEEAHGLPCTCGRAGHVEMIAAGPAILAEYLRNGGASSTLDTRAVFALADQGDECAATTIRVAATALGRTIGGLVNAIDPDIVVIGGGLSATGARWWAPLRAGIDLETIPAATGRPVVAAELGGDAAIVGAALASAAAVAGTAAATSTSMSTAPNDRHVSGEAR
ncbi:ROK family protein [Leifsonia sp. NCR5]|uniref:ROK family protein n=1 Tax=Leifsonia sp. NCR5 TaxID=1978342 RepID=UPI000A1986A9|nr:ROK family protein [Leifsonia sp. NCR5]